MQRLTIADDATNESPPCGISVENMSAMVSPSVISQNHTIAVVTDILKPRMSIPVNVKTSELARVNGTSFKR